MSVQFLYLAASLIWLRCEGYTQICVARGTVSWTSKDCAAGEIQLWYRERDNNYYLNSNKTARDGRYRDGMAFSILPETTMKVTKDTVTISELRRGLTGPKGQTVQLEDADPNELQLFMDKMPAFIKDTYGHQRRTEDSKLKEQLRVKDEQLRINEKQLREKDKQLREKDEQLREKDEQLRRTEKQLRRTEKQLTVKDEQLKMKEGELKDLRDQLQDFAVVQNKLSTAEKQLTKYESQSGSPDWVLCRDEVHFNWDQSLGAGSFGQVFKGRYCGCVVAIKKLHFSTLSQKQRDSFEREMKIASRCRHPCLLQFIGATQDESPLFVTELMETSLQKLLKKRKQENQHLSETEIIVICLDVGRALNYLHRRQPPIVHRDVSSANVLLWKQNNQWRGKLGDYGTAKFLEDTMTAHPGTQIYEAPEIRYPSGQTVAIDVFSFGVLFCEMCTGEPPEPENREDMVRQLTNKNFGQLILWCIEHDAKMRPSMGDIIENLEQLNHTS